MPAVKPGALPVEMLLPIMGPWACPALATLPVLPHRLRAQPEGKALPGHHPMEPLQAGKSLAPGASTALGSCAAGGWRGPSSRELQGDKETCFPLGRGALATSLMSQMEKGGPGVT